MKHGIRPTRSQKKLIADQGLDHKDWLIVKDTSEEMLLVHRHSEKTTRRILKE